MSKANSNQIDLFGIDIEPVAQPKHASAKYGPSLINTGAFTYELVKGQLTVTRNSSGEFQGMGLRGIVYQAVAVNLIERMYRTLTDPHNYSPAAFFSSVMTAAELATEYKIIRTFQEVSDYLEAA